MIKERNDVAMPIPSETAKFDEETRAAVRHILQTRITPGQLPHVGRKGRVAAIGPGRTRGLARSAKYEVGGFLLHEWSRVPWSTAALA